MAQSEGKGNLPFGRIPISDKLDLAVFECRIRNNRREYLSAVYDSATGLFKSFRWRKLCSKTKGNLHKPHLIVRNPDAPDMPKRVYIDDLIMEGSNAEEGKIQR